MAPNPLIQDWKDSCHGALDVDSAHFETLFMSELSRVELDAIFSPFPNAVELADLLEEVWRQRAAIPQAIRCQRILALVALDLAEKSRILLAEGEAALVEILNGDRYEFVEWDEFPRWRKGDVVERFLEAIGDHVLYELLPNDRNTMTLYHALYGVGSSLELRWSLIAPLFSNASSRFRHYLELWKLGGRYAVTEQGVVWTA